ncbi:MAG: ABC transporter substrate-binding protein/permease [Bacteroidales bacterium]|nr:ABC transporter substrate-binding protein/permease [Lentimicrobiaceae bacterium]MDD5694888.1 ABC transporter substrate-binding protein/permease [Bacteroidales bacterium]
MNRNSLFLFIWIILWLAACREKTATITSLSMLEGGKTFAVPTGTAADQFVLKKFPDAKILYFNTVLDCAIAVKTEKAHAAVYDKPILQNIAAKNEGLVVLSEMLFDDQYGFAVQQENTELKMVMDSVLAELQSNGIYDDMMKRWFPEHGTPAPMPDIESDGENGILRFGTAAVTEPMSFYDADHRIVGFDVEYASRIAKMLNKKLEIVDMEFGAMLPALIAGKVDMIGAGLSITEERAKKVLFSKSYYPSGIAAVVRSAAGEGKEGLVEGYRTIDDVKDKRIAVLLGSIHDAYVMKTYPDAKLLEYQNATDILTALKTDKADAGFYDHISLFEVFAENPDMGILAQDVFFADIAAGFNEENDTLREQFNAYLQTIKSNGIYDEMVNRWIGTGVKVMPDIMVPSPTGFLRFGVVGDLGMPFTLYRDGELTGFDIELGKRFAASLGKEYVPMDMQFSSLIAAVSTGKIDAITASMMITEEREKRIDFSEPYYRSGATLIALKKNLAIYRNADAEKNKQPFFGKMAESFHDNILLEKRYLLILDGLKTTVVISIFSAILGTLLGGVICFMRMSKRKILSGTAGLFITLIRGTPVLVLLMIIFYIIFASVNINPVLVAVIAFGINFGAYVSEMFRTSIQSVDRGQHEAGIASGFTRVQTFIHIILPQALRQVLPVYKGEFISMVKMTSIVGYVAVQDLTKASDIIRSRTFDAFFPLIMAAVIYLFIAWLLTWALSRVEISVDPKRKRSRKEMEAGL